MSLTLKQIETFVWVASLRNFRRVAERMNTTQPNISTRIAGLEAALDMKLFDRDTGTVELTRQGRAMLPLAERVLAAVDAFAEAGKEGQQRQVMRLGVAEMVVQTWLHGFLKEMRRVAPNVIVELQVDLTVNLHRGLLDRSLDLAFLNGPLPDYAVRNLALGTVPIIWVGTPELCAPFGGRVTAADLATQPILTHAKGTRPHIETVEYFRRAEAPDTRVVSSSNLAACLQMTLDGLGLATLPAPLVAPHIAAGELVQLDCDWVPTDMNFTASYIDAPPQQSVARAARLAQSTARWTARPRVTLPLLRD